MHIDVKTLAGSVGTIGDAAQLADGRLLVIEAALVSLVATHPDPTAFAAAFRRAFLQLGSQQSNPALSPQTQAGIDAVLGLLEEVCPVPLNVRPSPDGAA